MAREQIEARIKEIENARFYLNMKDRWEVRDYNRDSQLRVELLKLREMLK